MSIITFIFALIVVVILFSFFVAILTHVFESIKDFFTDETEIFIEPDD